METTHHKGIGVISHGLPCTVAVSMLKPGRRLGTVVHALIRFLLTSFVLGVFLLHISGLLPMRLIEQIERLSYDARVRMSLPGTIDPRIVIVDIDERSTQLEGQFPWPRHKLAQLLDHLYSHYQIRVLGFDVVFPEPDRQSGARFLEQLESGPWARLPDYQAMLDELREQTDGDRALADAIARHQPVMGYVLKGQRDQQLDQGLLPQPLFREALALPAEYYVAANYTANLDILQRATPYGGFFDNRALDSDGVFRRVPMFQTYDGAVYGSLALAVLSRALGDPPIGMIYDNGNGPRTALNLDHLAIGEIDVPLDEQAAVLVPYRGPQGSFPYVSATDVLSLTADPQVLRGAVVLLGTTAPGLLDLRSTPVGAAYAGVEIHANIISGILDGRIKNKVPYLVGIEFTILVLIGLLLTLVFPRLSPLGSTGLVAGMMVGITGLSAVAWSSGDFVLPTGAPLMFTLAVVLVQMTYGYFVESRAKREVSRIFGQYVPPELVEEMAERAESVEMHADSREMTVLFSDVRDFTSISEKLKPDELTELMNQFLTPLTGVIHRHRGTIDKYMGDAVMAFWGAPLTDAQHARHALEAARAMVLCMAELEEEFARRNWPSLRIGVGLNTGVMSVGNMGSEFRRAYTVLGDAVNLGSRLEGLTKQYGVEIICSDTTRRQVDDWLYRDLDKVRVKGKNEPVGIFEPLGPRDAVAAPLREELKQYRLALQAYRNQDWDQAELQFYRMQQSGFEHKIYAIYLERIAIFKANPPGADWDGVFTFTSK